MDHTRRQLRPRQRARPTDRLADRQRDGQKDRQADCLQGQKSHENSKRSNIDYMPTNEARLSMESPVFMPYILLHVILL